MLYAPLQISDYMQGFSSRDVAIIQQFNAV
jgi:hypothetical protein